ncbi:gag-pol polyprotein [Tanacetum coccineum]
MTLQPIQGRHTLFCEVPIRTYTSGASGSNSKKQRTVICYNCKGEGHMSKQCTKPKRKRDDSWFKKDTKVTKVKATKTVITHNVAYQANDLDAYDSDCNELNTAKVSLMANLSHYGLDALAEQAAAQNSNSSAQQETLILYVIEQLKTQVVNCTKINLDNKSVNDTLTAELERYKEQILKHDLTPQTELSAEQAFWSQNSVNSPEPTLSSRPTKVEVPKELPKIIMVNTSLKKLKHHLAGFDVVVKERTTATLSPQLRLVGSRDPQSQEKDKVIKKLKERIKSLSGKMNEEKIKKDVEEIETINIELDHRVSKLIAENEHLK